MQPGDALATIEPKPRRNTIAASRVRAGLARRGRGATTVQLATLVREVPAIPLTTRSDRQTAPAGPSRRPCARHPPRWGCGAAPASGLGARRLHVTSAEDADMATMESRRTPMGTPAAEIEHLNSFLRGEISAVEPYRQVLDRVGSLPEAAELRDCMRSHEHRVMRLREEVARRGGRPAESSGAWGALAKLIEGGAAAFGPKAAIAALEHGEDHGRNDYQRDVGALGREAKMLVEQYLLPEQLRTHAVISRLKRMLP